jgi:hypothetical protein
MLVHQLLGGCNGDFAGCWELVVFKRSAAQLSAALFCIDYGHVMSPVGTNCPLNG